MFTLAPYYSSQKLGNKSEVLTSALLLSVRISGNNSRVPIIHLN